MKKWLDINADYPENAKVFILGIPFDGGTSQEAGAAEGPAKIREFGEVYMPCATDDWHVLDTQPVVYDFGDVDMSGTWEEKFARVEAEAFELMGYGKFNLFIGGDHSVTIPLHKAFAKARTGEKIGIIHFDAHFDLCDCYDGHKWSHANTEKRALDDIRRIYCFSESALQSRKRWRSSKEKKASLSSRQRMLMNSAGKSAQGSSKKNSEDMTICILRLISMSLILPLLRGREPLLQAVSHPEN